MTIKTVCTVRCTILKGKSTYSLNLVTHFDSVTSRGIRNGRGRQNADLLSILTRLQHQFLIDICANSWRPEGFFCFFQFLQGTQQKWTSFCLLWWPFVVFLWTKHTRNALSEILQFYNTPDCSSMNRLQLMIKGLADSDLTKHGSQKPPQKVQC